MDTIDLSLPAPMPEVGAVYQHYARGTKYLVTGFSRDADDLALCVNYVGLADGVTWTRKLSLWSAPLEGPGARYAKIADAPVLGARFPV